MTATLTPVTPTVAIPDAHLHTYRCWWDCREARWTCDLGWAVRTLADVVGVPPAAVDA